MTTSLMDEKKHIEKKQFNIGNDEAQNDQDKDKDQPDKLMNVKGAHKYRINKEEI